MTVHVSRISKTVRVTAPKGTPGTAATVSVGNTTTLGAGSAATVTNVGTSSAAVFDFGIPRGVDGSGTGDMTVATYDPGTVAGDAFDMDNMSDGTTKKAFLATERTKLSGIATAATANDTDANLKNRANHTGTQTLSTISDAGTAASLDEATAAQFRSNTADKALSTDQVWASAEEVTLDGSTATTVVDMATFLNASLTLGANRTLQSPTNAKEGQSGLIRIVQDGTGGRTLSFASNYEFAGGTAPTLSTDANAEDFLFYKVVSSTRIFITAALDIS